jgi:hypothetical protein
MLCSRRQQSYWRRCMTFDDILDQVIVLLQRQGRVSYRALAVRFDLDDEYLEALEEEIWL